MILPEPRFAFIIAHTPPQFRSPLRDELFAATCRSLERQTYPHWQALVISDKDESYGKIRFLKAPAHQKGDKIEFGLKVLAQAASPPDYVIRLDDDDLVNPDILHIAADMEFDCLADNYHHFLELVTGKVSSQKREWLANTVIHKFSCATTMVQNLPLLALDHSHHWHRFYADKKLVYLPKTTPLYLRILSPTSVTAGANNQVTPAKRKNEYKKYLLHFGKWKKARKFHWNGLAEDVNAIRKHLTVSWAASFKAPSFSDRLLEKIRRKLK